MLLREAPSSRWKTASAEPPSVWPVQEAPRSKATMPPSKDSPAAMVWTALRTDVPEEAGSLPPDEPEPPDAGAAVVAGAELLPEEAAPVADAALPDLVTLAVAEDDLPLLDLVLLEAAEDELDSSSSSSSSSSARPLFWYCLMGL